MYRLPELPYSYSDLEPAIDERTMEIHHQKHHAGYVDKLNRALETADELEDEPLEDLMRDLEKVPQEIRTAVRNNGGGHLNHSLFWETMTPDGPGRPEADLAAKIEEDLGGFAELREAFSEAATSRFGSGWAWLVLDDDRLAVGSTPNQDSPLIDGKIPLLGLDVWEHAYYLRYQNRRADYVEAWWDLVSWRTVASRLETVAAAEVTA